jgi:NAD(P)-dependent dehydrogenase (short-subunit alcohol dehydrogenase family)
MEVHFDDQVVLITGASTGIGAVLARAFGVARANVVVHYHSNRDAANTVAHDIEAAGGKALLIGADITDASQLETIVATTLEHFDRIDILINNAGSLIQRQVVAEMSDAVYQEMKVLNIMVMECIAGPLCCIMARLLYTVEPRKTPLPQNAPLDITPLVAYTRVHLTHFGNSRVRRTRSHGVVHS